MANLKRGTYVSRSTYQKTVEENIKLRSDIYWLTMRALDYEAIKIKDKWQKAFRKEASMNAMIQNGVRKFIRDNPDDPSVIKMKEIIASVNAERNKPKN